jgi:hypothetical protein
METKILTIPTANVNDELRVRQAFGWRLSQASARSFATSGNMLGVGSHVGGGIVVGGGQVQLHNAHFTDIVLERASNPRIQGLAELENRYDSVQYRPQVSHWSTVIVAALVFGVGLFGGIAVAVQFGMDPNQSISPAFFLVPAAMGIALGVLVTGLRQRRRTEYNRRVEAQQQQILQATGAFT